MVTYRKRRRKLLTFEAHQRGLEKHKTWCAFSREETRIHWNRQLVIGYAVLQDVESNTGTPLKDVFFVASKLYTVCCRFDKPLVSGVGCSKSGLGVSETRFGATQAIYEYFVKSATGWCTNYWRGKARPSILQRVCERSAELRLRKASQIWVRGEGLPFAHQGMAAAVGDGHWSLDSFNKRTSKRSLVMDSIRHD